MHTFKRNFIIALGSFAAGIVVSWLVSVYAGLAVPSLTMLVAASIPNRGRTRKPEEARSEDAQQTPGQGETAAVRSNVASVSSVPSASSAHQAPSASSEVPKLAIADPELASASEYIGVIQDMILLEGEKNMLDDEIVQKTLALLSRINRLIPDLDALGDSNINYNIVRLVRRDLNSTINPFLRLSGEAKRQNRRLLLDGIKDINAKLTAYTQTIEQKDLLELRTKAELIQQRYRYND